MGSAGGATSPSQHCFPGLNPCCCKLAPLLLLLLLPLQVVLAVAKARNRSASLPAPRTMALHGSEGPARITEMGGRALSAH